MLNTGKNIEEEQTELSGFKMAGQSLSVSYLQTPEWFSSFESFNNFLIRRRRRSKFLFSLLEICVFPETDEHRTKDVYRQFLFHYSQWRVSMKTGLFHMSLAYGRQAKKKSSQNLIIEHKTKDVQSAAEFKLSKA